MTESRAVVPGYVRAHLLMTEHELADIKHDLALFAEEAGYTLGRVFVERVDRIPAAFAALLDLLHEDKPDALVTPTVVHLAPLGFPPKVMHYLESVTGARVLLANMPVPSELAGSPHNSTGSAT